MPRGKKNPLPPGVLEAWSHVVGFGNGRVVAYEDLARDRKVTLRWRPKGVQQWRRKTTNLRIEREARGRHKGEPTAESIVAAIAAATEKSNALFKGAGEPVPDSPAAPLTIGRTRAAITDEHTGRYPHDTPFRRELLRALDFAETVWGTDTLWMSIDELQWTALVRRRLESLLKRGKKAYRTTEITVSRLATVTTWLRRVKKIPREAGLPPEDWREQLLEHWRNVTRSTRDPEPDRPRHTLDEMRKILAIADVIDPRLDLLLKLGAEYRLGQVVRAWRSDLDVQARTLKVYGQGKKGGATIDLTEGQMRAVFTALGGYLDELEEQYLADGTDYLLFPSGRLLRWREEQPTMGDAVDYTRPLSRGWIRRNFHLAEVAAGVTKLDGRAAYGLRRQAVDAATAEGISPTGLKASGGWSSSKVPDEIYREQENKIGRAEAKRVRAKIRGEEG
jgi:hypothetical protein